MNKRCLMVITGALTLGGGIAAANRLALSALLKAGYEVDVIALNELSNASTSISNLRTYRGMGNRKVSFAMASWKAILTRQYHVIFCDHVNLAMMLAPLSWLRLARYSVRLNGIEVFPGELNWEGRLGLMAAHKRTAISDHTREMVIKQFPNLAVTVCDLSLDEKRSALSQPATHLMHPSISLQSVAGSTQALRNKVILHVGRMSTAEKYKGQDVLIQSMSVILKEQPEAQLVLVGKGDDADRLRTLAQSQPETVQEAIFMPGFVSDEQLEHLYQSCYVFAMPSRGEGFGLVYLEAMAYAKPCLGSRIDSAKCIIREGETGVLVDDPTSTKQVAESLVKLLNDSEDARLMGIAGYELLKRYYLFSHFQERFIQILQ